jgi:hypothetical protein
MIPLAARARKHKILLWREKVFIILLPLVAS